MRYLLCFVLVFMGIENHKLSAQTSAMILISEIMAGNVSTLQDEDAEYTDWIELVNQSDEDLSLGGYYLSDDPNNLIKWLIPDVIIKAHEYLIIFASGKDRYTSPLHTNFKLSSNGEHLFLTNPDGKTIESAFSEPYPYQITDISYSLIEEAWYYSSPTPGMPNQVGSYINPPKLSKASGLVNEPFYLEVFSPQGETIIYTTDCSEPGLTNGEIYTHPIWIDSTRVIRAASFFNGKFSTSISGTYIFTEQVQFQPETPPGYPLEWGKFTQIEGVAPAHYGMDQEITQHPVYGGQLIPGLQSIPSLFVVTSIANLFSPEPNANTGGIYIHTGAPTGGLGKDWERSASVAYVKPDGTLGFQINGGLRIHGGHSRVPEKNPKHSFRLIFREQYGPTKLFYDLFDENGPELFNSLVLRGGFNQTWMHWSSGQRKRAQYIHDSWAKDTWRKMGHIAARNKFIHLYLNGLYWGLYNISERMDQEFMASFSGGNENDYDIIKDYAELAEGQEDAWNMMMQIAENGLEDMKSFYLIQGKDENGKKDESLEAYLDVENLIDYMILNLYAGNQDWDHHNWVAMRNREDPGNGFQFIPWDSEMIFVGKNDNIINENNTERPSFLYSQLRKNPSFRRQFATRVAELLGAEGILGPESVKSVFLKRAKEIELAIIAESARWGDYRRDKHSYSDGPFELYTPHHWKAEQERLITGYFPGRSQTVINQFEAEGLFGDAVTGIYVADWYSGIQVYPLPFGHKVTLNVSLESKSQVQIRFYSANGIELHFQNLGILEPGEHLIEWHAADNLKNGLYYYQLIVGLQSFSGKLLMKK